MESLLIFFNMFRLRMTPKLDIYSFGMVVMFLFLEKTWWNGLRSPRSLDIAAREQQVNTQLAQLERILVLGAIAKQVCAMLDPDPKDRPDAAQCSFELRPPYYGA